MADWLGITSANYDSSCGSSSGFTVSTALDGTTYWYHTTNETHWFIIDLGASYTITKVKSRSNSDSDPIDVNIYVSNSKVDWGDAVATGITTWRDTSDFVEINTTEKTGRYIEVEIISTEHSLHRLRFGKGAAPYFTIFDVYGVLGPQDYDEGNLVVTGTGLVVLSTEEAEIAEHYDEGTLVISGVGSVLLSTESVTFAYNEGVLVISGSGTVSLSTEHTSFLPPSDKITYKRLVVVTANKLWYENI